MNDTPDPQKTKLAQCLANGYTQIENVINPNVPIVAKKENDKVFYFAVRRSGALAAI